MNAAGILQAPAEYRNNCKYDRRKWTEQLKEILMELMILTVLHINRSSACLKSYPELVDASKEHFQALWLQCQYI